MPVDVLRDGVADADEVEDDAVMILPAFLVSNPVAPLWVPAAGDALEVEKDALLPPLVLADAWEAAVQLLSLLLLGMPCRGAMAVLACMLLLLLLLLLQGSCWIASLSPSRRRA